eukprot:TRINITY_DN33424_c0_g1_i1.p1 TRINITY_DN33424_c0_g1~~TRINITY_DN33424_c0_g1_i1.p1  ORF type:complete len:320 (+),score=64.46 TRINITY_DN33424_c0_g1_i1:220-1179(+)
MALPRRVLGRTGLELSILGFGASPLGNVFGNINEEEGIAAVHLAVELGINFFDVSPFYGGTLAEQVLGKALKTLPRESFFLSTKVGRYGPESFDFSAERVTRSVDESLARLNVQHIDIIQCHDIEFGSLDQIVSETLPALKKLKEAGKVRFIGITGLPLKIFREVLTRAPPGLVDVVLSYCHNSLNDTSLVDDLLPFLEAQGVGVISASPLSMGLLTVQGPPTWHPAPPEVQAASREAAELCKSKGGNISLLALQKAVEHPSIATTLVGMCSLAQVRENVEAVIAASEGKINGQLLSEVEAVLRPVKNITWPSGLPENN